MLLIHLILFIYFHDLFIYYGNFHTFTICLNITFFYIIDLLCHGMQVKWYELNGNISISIYYEVIKLML